MDIDDEESAAKAATRQHIHAVMPCYVTSRDEQLLPCYARRLRYILLKRQR